MATLTVYTTALDGVTPSYVAATGGGDDFVNSTNTLLHIKNGSGGDITVTVNSLKSCSYGFDHDSVTVVTAGSEEIVGPFDTKRFNDSNGKAAITYSGVTSLTIAAFKLA
ncbi:MAG: hypothetical protein OEW37_00195 [Rhodospirillaceae bacterium]|nr:hypothetical protein [Rhodospirillaceae bacterium]